MIQYSTPNASLYAALAGGISRVPVRLYCQWGLAYVGFRGLKRKVFKAIEKVVCKLSTWIEPDSYSNLNFAHAEGLYPESIGSVVWNGSACGVDLKRFDFAKKDEYRRSIREAYGIPAGSFVFGFVGRVTRDKGVNELLEAFHNIVDTDSSAHLLMVGPQEVDSTIDRDLYEWSTVSKNVVYTGYTRVVEQLLSAMDCYVLPSYREGFGMSVIEAEAMCVPVIVTNIPGPTDAMIRNVTGIIVEKQDVQGLEMAMRKMMRSDLESYGRNGLSLVRNRFDQEELFRHILADRKEMLGE